MRLLCALACLAVADRNRALGQRCQLGDGQGVKRDGAAGAARAAVHHGHNHAGRVAGAASGCRVAGVLHNRWQRECRVLAPSSCVPQSRLRP